MRPYYRFYIFFAVTIFILCSLWVLGVYAQLGVPVLGESRECYIRFAFKKNRAESIESPKLILMSGSNGRYGVDTEKLEKSLRIPSVNMAIHAGLGLEYILYQSRSVAHSGDVILAPLEYSLYGEKRAGKPTELCIDYVLAYDPGYFKMKGLKQKAEFISGMNLIRFLAGLLHSVFSVPITLMEHEFLPINKNGDETDNIGQKVNADDQALEEVLLQKGGISETALRRLSDFIDECRRNGVRFFAAYPSLLYNEVYLSEAARENIAAIEAFYASKNVPVLGTFEDFLYPIEDMHDTRYHLNAEGREKRTRLLLKLLKPYSRL